MSFILGDLKVRLTVRAPDRIAEVRDEETGELIDHLWAPQPDQEIDFSNCVVTFRLRPTDLDDMVEE